MVENTKNDGIDDLRDLQIQKGLSNTEFIAAIQRSLNLMPSLSQIMNEIPKGINDNRGREIIAQLRPELGEQNQRKQWQIVRDWIGFFFKNEFDVAPESFIIRLKPRA